ncbi:MAG: transposase [Clostridia bacterium]|nr:transposase [Clostridia bacterium]
MSDGRAKKNGSRISVSLDSLIGDGGAVRDIDEFVEGLDMTEYEIDDVASSGFLKYDTKGMIKLYIYGCRKGIFLPERLAELCRMNAEVMWLLSETTPSAEKIAEFRRENTETLRRVFREFNRRSVQREDLEGEDAVRTLESLDSRSDEYVRVLEGGEGRPSADAVQMSLEDVGTDAAETYSASLERIEKMKVRAREGYFVRDEKNFVVYCPGGLLRQKAVREDGTVTYASEKACRRCSLSRLCMTIEREYVSLDFPKGCEEIPCEGVLAEMSRK